MTALGRELVAVLTATIANDADLAQEIADALAPYPTASAGWMSATETVDYLGLGSLDALDRLVRDGLPCSQPHGPGGRRYFHPPAVDAWMRSR